MTPPPGGGEEGGKGGLDAVMAHAGDEGDATGRVVRVEPVQEAAKRIGIKARSAFDADRIGEAAGEFDMSRAGETGAVADPAELRRRSVIAAGVVVPAEASLLEGPESRLMTRVTGRSIISGEVFSLPKGRTAGGRDGQGGAQ